MKRRSVAVWLGVFLSLSGCQTARLEPGPFDLVLNKTTSASIKLDLIGVSPIVKHAWEGYDLDQYWAEGDSRRAGADKLSVELTAGQPLVVRRDDPHWQSWIRQGATELMVIADLPGQFPAANDPRRIFIPLDKRAWSVKSDTLEIQVQDTMLSPITR